MIFDIEADGLLDKATKIHVLSYEDKGGVVRHTHDYDEMRTILTNAKVLIGHNIISYDVILAQKILGIKIKARLIDTLALSWTLNHKRVRHGLEWYGVDYGVPKPKIDDWDNLSPEEYAHRCNEDVKINSKLWQQLRTKLLKLYEGDRKAAGRYIDYLSFKMRCLAEQEKHKWRLDVDKAQKNFDELEKLFQEALPKLKAEMPDVPVYVTKTKPAKPYKKDGSLSVTGAKWFNLLKEKGLPENHTGDIKIVSGYNEPNPQSTPQIKDWLFSLGWKPESFDYKKNEDGSMRAVPQIRIEEDGAKVLCPSVTKLIKDNPSVAVLDNLTVIKHRMDLFGGFLNNHKDGWLVAEAGGLTNTLRFKHRVLVNLPGVDKPWGKEIRGCLIAPEGFELLGSDMNSLEENTKKHYMFPYDPEYVKEMSKPGFDAHLDLALNAGAITKEEMEAYVQGAVDAVTKLKPIRKNYKAANYSCIYGVGKDKLARDIDVSVFEAAKLIEAYWQRNWSVKQLSEDATVKMVDGELWLYNPVSRFYYSLRNKKDIFSTLNQGTGVYCFDSWIMELFNRGSIRLIGQFHDEIILLVRKGLRDKYENLLNTAIEAVNDKLKLNVQLGVGIDFGNNYSEIH